MVLRKSEFTIPANFIFQPFSAKWRFVSAELVEWVESPKKILRAFVSAPEKGADKNWLRVRIAVPHPSASEHALGLYIPGIDPSYTVLMDRATIPPDVLQPHENERTNPDIAGRRFITLICSKPEFKDSVLNLKPGQVTKNAFLMQDEFLNLGVGNDDDWPWLLQEFLNKWGLWESNSGFREDWPLFGIASMVAGPVTDAKYDRPDFVLVMPHLLKEMQKQFRAGSEKRNRRQWLKDHRLNISRPDEPPFFVVRESYCKNVIEATITIDHLAERTFGICKNCGNRFEHDTKHKRKIYCSRPCIKAGSQRNWRKNQKKQAKKKVQGRK